MFRKTHSWYALGGFFASTLIVDVCYAQHAQAGYGLEVLSVKVESDTSLSVVFRETTTDYADFKFEMSLNLTDSVEAWVEVSPTEFFALQDGGFEAVLPITANASRYFRITGKGSLFDLDGDGLSNSAEARYGTDENLPDTDNDKFSDLLEIQAGTDPNDENDQPDFSFYPVVRFSIQRELIEEGSYSHSILVESDKPLYGDLNYALSALSNTDTADASLKNSLRFTGETSAQIQLDIQDDAELEQIETIMLDLLDATDGNYRRGSIVRNIVVIEDNDALWTGSVVENGAETTFRMSLIREGSKVTGTLLSSLDSPSGVIPVGQWNLTCTLGPDSFTAVSEPLPMSSALLFDIEMERTLTIEVVPPADPDNLGEFEAYYFKPRLMVGILSDSLIAKQGGSSFFNQSGKALVVLVKDIQIAEEIVVPEVVQ